MAIQTEGRPMTDSKTAAPQPQRFAIQHLGRPGISSMALAVLAIILVACGGGSDDGRDQMPSVASGQEVAMSTPDDLAPSLAIKLSQGADKLGAAELDLAALQGTPVVLNFWAAFCPPCRAELPELQAFYEEFSDRITLIGIDIGVFTGLGEEQDGMDLLEELNITYPAGVTHDNKVVRRYEILSMPTTFFIRSDGTIFKKWSGALNKGVLEKETNAMLGQ